MTLIVLSVAALFVVAMIFVIAFMIAMIHASYKMGNRVKETFKNIEKAAATAADKNP